MFGEGGKFVLVKGVEVALGAAVKGDGEGLRSGAEEVELGSIQIPDRDKDGAVWLQMSLDLGEEVELFFGVEDVVENSQGGDEVILTKSLPGIGLVDIGLDEFSFGVGLLGFGKKNRADVETGVVDYFGKGS